MAIVANLMAEAERTDFGNATVFEGDPHGGHADAGAGERAASRDWAAEMEEGSGDTIVGRTTEALRLRIGEVRYDFWFNRKTRLTVAGNVLLVDVANGFSAKWIREKFREELGAAVRAAAGRDLEVRVRVDEAAAPARGERGGEGAGAAEAPAAAARQSAKAPAAQALRYTLEEFVVGPSNQMAYHAAVRVAQQPGQLFNPLFIHGHCGLGKTHLLQGICQRFGQMHPGKKWLYMTGEQFTNEFLEAIKQHKTEAFRRRIRHTDLLVLDDVHFLANKKATQEEFLHTFNQVDAGGRQVVLASDCAPKEIQSLSEQLSSRFVSGMVLRVDSPDLPTRLEILRRRVLRNGWNIADSVLMHIAQTSTSSVRELEGMLLQVVAGISLINSGSAGAASMGRGAGGAESVLASIRERVAMRQPVPVDRIVAAAAEYFAVTPAAIMESGREKKVATARAMAMYLARQHTGMSFPEIGRALGNKNHSTVIAACQRVEAMLTSGKLLAWNTPEGPRHQAASDAVHELEAAIRRAR